MQIPAQIGFARWQVHLRHDPLDDVASIQNATVSVECETIRCRVINNSAARRLLILDFLGYDLSLLQRGPVFDMAPRLGQTPAILFGAAYRSAVDDQSAPQ